jgi:hypothetical protein
MVFAPVDSSTQNRKRAIGTRALGALAMWSTASPKKRRRLPRGVTVTPSPATNSKATKMNYDYLAIIILPVTDESEIENTFCGLCLSPSKSEGNVLLPFEELRKVIEALLCGTCGAGGLVVQARTRGFASSLSVLCTNPSCGVWRNANATRRTKVFDRGAHRSCWKNGN